MTAAACSLEREGEKLALLFLPRSDDLLARGLRNARYNER